MRRTGTLVSDCCFVHALGKVDVGPKLLSRKQKEVNPEFLLLDELEEQNTETASSLPRQCFSGVKDDSISPQATHSFHSQIAGLDDNDKRVELEVAIDQDVEGMRNEDCELGDHEESVTTDGEQ
ncbi:uncharacterized protein KY384_006289 [Bacidia gigantensis]|uniref:uncharacterized protein n=1 Tax=Bacidia gigantensis TaxID=2732470 RepID=UPI001D05270D|nr:uncharacterized protein KY384_006289 [Bacidia gigantensis]KAG8528602.1 hypothetical protein KY384_006289 [Bacidia gigantensis]